MPADLPIPGDSALRRRIPPLIFLLSFPVLYCIAVPLLDDPDTPWHLAAGELLWRTHHVPDTDPWSFASQGQTWYLLSWGWDGLIAGIERIAGEFGVFTFTLTILSALLAAFAAELLRRPVALGAVILTVTLATFSILGVAMARPQVAGYMLALLFQIVLHDSRSHAGYGKLLWLPPLMLLWVNLHGSFIVGFTILGAYVAEAWLTRNRTWLRHLIVVSVICAIWIFLNPYGLDIVPGVMVTLNSTFIINIAEWKPFVFGHNLWLSVWLMLFIVFSNVKTANAGIADKLLAYVWLVCCLLSIRNGTFFIILSAPYFAACLDEQTRTWRWDQPPSGILTLIERQSLERVWLACAAGVTLFVGAAAILPHHERLQSDDRGITDATNFARAHYPADRYLVDYNLSGLTIYRTSGRLSIFVDGRAESVYSEKTIQDYMAFELLRPDWQKQVKAYGIKAIIVYKNHNFAKAFANGYYHDTWQQVFSGKNANVYIARR